MDNELTCNVHPLHTYDDGKERILKLFEFTCSKKSLAKIVLLILF